MGVVGVTTGVVGATAEVDGCSVVFVAVVFALWFADTFAAVNSNPPPPTVLPALGITTIYVEKVWSKTEFSFSVLSFAHAVIVYWPVRLGVKIKLLVPFPVPV